MTKPGVKKMAELSDLIEEVDRLLLPGGDLDLAEERVEVALKTLSSSHSQIEVARVYTQAAQIKVELGKYKETEAYGLRALELLRDTAEHKLRGKAQWCLGRAYIYLGEIDKSRMFFEDSRSTYRTIGYKQGELEALNGLIHLDFIGSDWSSAKKKLKYAYQINQESGDRRGMALCLTNGATVSILLGEHNAAEKALIESIEIKETLGDPLLLTHSWLSLARLYLRERRWSEASKLIQKAKKVSKEHTFSRELVMSLESEGELYFQQKEYAKAEKSYLDALKIGEQISPEGDVVAELCRKLADLYVAIEKPDPDKAIEYGQRGLKVSTKLGDRFEQGCCHRPLAVAYHLKGLRDRSQGEFAKAISVLRSIGDRFELAKILLTQGELSGRGDLLREARRLFAQIQGADFYQALTKMELAKVEPSFRSAIGHLREAEEIFRAEGEEKELKRVEAVKGELNKRLTQPTTQKYKVLRDLASPQLGEVFEGIFRDLKADQGFVAYRNNGKMKIEGSHNLTQEEATKVLSLLTGNNDLQPGEPFILYDTGLDDRFSSLGAGSVMIAPFASRSEGEADGYLYLARQGDKEPFLDKEYDLFYSLSHVAEKAISEERQRELERELASLKRQLRLSGEIVTQDPRMLRVLDEVEVMKDAGYPVLIMGESGTGKELIAKLIHSSGARKGKPFKAINCGAIPENLLESELFGHERGTFTGAYFQKKGKLEKADGGTVFLDEIGELSPKLQVKLLRVLEEGKLERVGGNTSIRFDVRIIAATNKDLYQATLDGSFREDIYYRIEGATLWLPPLRERKDDIPLLCDHFIKLYGEKFKKKVRGITPEALELLMEYDWPGNVRQLKRAIEVAVSRIEGEEGEVTLELIRRGTPWKQKQALPQKAASLPEELAVVEKERCLRALKKCNWKITEAANMLGVPRTTLHNKMKKLNILPTKASEDSNLERRPNLVK